MSDETKTEDPKPEWQYRNGFAINTQMKEVIEATIKMAQAEIGKYRKKLKKLTYGA